MSAYPFPASASNAVPNSNGFDEWSKSVIMGHLSSLIFEDIHRAEVARRWFDDHPSSLSVSDLTGKINQYVNSINDTLSKVQSRMNRVLEFGRLVNQGRGTAWSELPTTLLDAQELATAIVRDDILASASSEQGRKFLQSHSITPDDVTAAVENYGLSEYLDTSSLKIPATGNAPSRQLVLHSIAGDSSLPVALGLVGVIYPCNPTPDL
jgi:hypothetical protein